jgi:peptidyl-prolyl cis-trans isomerase SurA
MKKTWFWLAAAIVVLPFIVAIHPHFALAQNQGVVATVNDVPITTLDIDQNLQLMKILGENPEVPDSRKAALRTMIDEIIKIAEAKKYKVNASDKEIDAQIERVAKSLKTDSVGLQTLLKKYGISLSLLKQRVAAQIAFSRILAGKYQVKISVDPAEVDKKFADIKSGLEEKVNTIMNDPRMKPMQIYTILEIDLPVENASDPMLLQARAVEASQLIQRFKGCETARAAASGIFNVKIGKKIEAVAAKIPKPMKQALDNVGPGKAMGPARGPNGIQIIGFCGKSTLQPPKPKYQLPTRQQVEIMISNEKYAAVEAKYMGEMRKRAYVEYKDPAYAMP